MRAMGGVKLINRKNTNELMQMFGVTVPIERMLTAAAMRWYEHTLQRGEANWILK